MLKKWKIWHVWILYLRYDVAPDPLPIEETDFAHCFLAVRVLAIHTDLWWVPVSDIVEDALLQVAGLCSAHPVHQMSVNKINYLDSSKFLFFSLANNIFPNMANFRKMRNNYYEAAFARIKSYFQKRVNNSVTA